MNKMQILLFAILVSSSGFAQNIDLVEQLPKVEGSWRWRHTVVGGFVGIVAPQSGEDFVLTFGQGNKMSIAYKGEMLISDETFQVAVSKDRDRGKYVITFAEEVKKRMEEKMKGVHVQVITSGFVAIEKAFGHDEAESLVISAATGVNMGSEGGPDFHRTSLFVPVNKGKE